MISEVRNADKIEVANDVKNTLKSLQNDSLQNMSLVLQTDRSQYIEKEVRRIIARSLLTLGILLVFVLLISLNIRYTLLILISLMDNLAIAFFLYYLSGIALHLYSFAGITISLGILIDNSIVMIDHLRYKHNKKVVRAIFASTITTIGALTVIYFLPERARLILSDFAMVVMINLAVSLFVSLFLLPALMQYMPPMAVKNKKGRWMKRRIRIVRITHLYESILRLLVRFKTPVFLIVILGFGLPLFLLPFKTEKPRENLWVNLYNHTFGSEIYQQKIKKIADPLLGGTLRLFVNNVHRNPFFTDKERTTLYVRAHLSEGAILEQMNAMFLQLEHYLGQFQQIDQFVTNISGPNQAALYITFKQPCENTGFPIVLQNLLINKAIDFGSADWRIYGRGDAFNNSTREQVGRYKIDLYGYNYDALSTHASVLKKQLLNNPRVQEVDVMGKDRWFRDNLHEYVLREDKEKLFIKNSYITSLYKDIKLGSDSREYGGTVTIKNKQYPYVLSSLSSKQFTTWKLQHDAFTSSNGFQKINDVAVVQKEKTSKTIYKKNQQYYLLVAYDFIGPDQLGLMHCQTTVEDFSRELPVGYTAKKQGYRGGGSENRNTYWFIFLVVVIIYFICATLLESLWQPLAIIAMIPVTFIGVFLTFYLFDLAFDEGGYTSFVLLCGLTVNAALYIINELNNLRRQFQHRAFQKDFSFQMYLKAFNSKIVPALLAIASTILGLIPFLAAGQQEIFWFPLAAGTTGGLIFSLVGIFGVLPLFFIKRRIGSKKAPGESINYKDKP